MRLGMDFSFLTLFNRDPTFGRTKFDSRILQESKVDSYGQPHYSVRGPNLRLIRSDEISIW